MIDEDVDINDDMLSEEVENSEFSNVSEVKYVRGGTVLAACPSDYEGVFEIPEGVQILGNSCFRYCTKITEIRLPSTLTIVSREAFRDMTGLLKFVVSKDNEIYSTTEDGKILYSEQEKTLIKATSDLKSYHVSDIIEVIGGYAFQNCKDLKEVELPNGLRCVLVAAFNKCISLEKIVIPDTVEKIANKVFEGCTSLMEIKLPDLIRKMSINMFAGCVKLETVNIPLQTKTISEEAFADCMSLKSIHIPETVKKIGESAFVGCESLEEITVDDDNKKYSAEENVLYNKYQTRLIRCPSNFDSFIVPELISSIAKNAFNGCKNLKNVYLPPYLMKIEEYTFNNCENIETIDIPENVVVIKRGAFEGCSNLEHINISENSSLRKIEDYAFYGCKKLKNIFLPEMLTEICDHDINGGATFGECESLEEIDLPPRIPYLNESMFFGCKNLKTVKIPYNVLYLDSDLFCGCDSLKTVILRNEQTKIEEGTFAQDVKIIIDEENLHNKIYFEI